MLFPSHPRLACALLLALSLTTEVRADPVRFKYDWTPTPGFVPAGTGGGGIRLTDLAEYTAAGTSRVVGSRLQAVTSAHHTAPDVIGPNDGFFTLHLKLTDIDSGQSGTLTFDGRLSGWLSLEAVSGRGSVDPAPKSIVLGSHGYTVDDFAVYLLSPPGQTPSFDGVYARITVADVKQAPEPAGLTLLAVGGACCGAAGLRRRRVSRSA